MEKYPYKRSMCRYYMNCVCRKGQFCIYAHGFSNFYDNCRFDPDILRDETLRYHKLQLTGIIKPVWIIRSRTIYIRKSPVRRHYRSGSPVCKRRRSRSPKRKHHRSKSPKRKRRSRSPERKYLRSRSPERKYLRSRSPKREHLRSRSPKREHLRSRSLKREHLRSRSPIKKILLNPRIKYLNDFCTYMSLSISNLNSIQDAYIDNERITPHIANEFCKMNDTIIALKNHISFASFEMDRL